jgi:hypothetical protein
MGVIEAVLALIGLLALISAAVRWHLGRASDQPLAADRAALYRAGLDAATRIQTAAQDFEQQLYAEAVRRAEGGKASVSEKTRQQ